MFKGSTIGPADFFNYSYSTNHIWFKIIGPFAELMLKAFRMHIVGMENIPKDTNFVLMGNHISHADSYFVISPLWRVKPFHFIADEKLFKSRWFRIIAGFFNVFPVRKGMKSMKIVDYAVARVANEDNLLWYPEGSRQKNPSKNVLKPGKLGSGMIAHKTEIPIVPFFLYGPEFAMPVGRTFWFGKRPHTIDVLVKYGKPIYLDDLRAEEESKETSSKILDRIMDSIEALRPSGPYYDQSDKI